MKQKFKSNKSFDDVKGSSDKEPRVEDLVDVYKFPAKQWVQVRFVGPLVSYGRHWIQTKKLDGSLTKFPKTCLSYDPETEEHDSTKSCPWCDVQDERIDFGPEYYQNAIIREIEEDGPNKKAAKPSKNESKTGIKDRGSKAWTPVRVVRLTASMIREIKKLGGLNRHKDKKTGEKKAYSVSHVKYGCDISIQYDPDEKVASKKYSFQKGDASALSEEQQEYLLYQIEDMMHPGKKSDEQKEVKRWLEKMGKKSKGKGSDDDDSDDDDSDDDSDDDDEDDTPKGKDKKGKDKKKSKSKSDDDEDDDDLPEEDDDDEDEPKGKKKGKKDKKSKSDDDDDDLDDEDDSDSDDDDSDDDDSDDDEDEPKGKKKGKKDKKSKSDDDDDDLDDEDELDDDDEDEEDEPKGKKSKGKSKDKKKDKKSKSKSDDDEDDLDDDLDDDEDSDDEDSDDDEDDKPKGKGKKGKDKKKGKKSKSDEDDDDEDDDD